MTDRRYRSEASVNKTTHFQKTPPVQIIKNVGVSELKLFGDIFSCLSFGFHCFVLLFCVLVRLSKHSNGQAQQKEYNIVAGQFSTWYLVQGTCLGGLRVLAKQLLSTFNAL